MDAPEIGLDPGSHHAAVLDVNDRDGVPGDATAGGVDSEEFASVGSFDALSDHNGFLALDDFLNALFELASGLNHVLDVITGRDLVAGGPAGQAEAVFGVPLQVDDFPEGLGLAGSLPSAPFLNDFKRTGHSDLLARRWWFALASGRFLLAWSGYSRSVRGSPKRLSTLLSMKLVMAAMRLPSRVSTSRPVACAIGACASSR